MSYVFIKGKLSLFINARVFLNIVSRTKDSLISYGTLVPNSCVVLHRGGICDIDKNVLNSNTPWFPVELIIPKTL